MESLSLIPLLPYHPDPLFKGNQYSAIFQIFYIYTYRHTHLLLLFINWWPTFLNPPPYVSWWLLISLYNKLLVFFMAIEYSKEALYIILPTIYQLKWDCFQSFAKTILQWVALYLTLFSHVCRHICKRNSCVKGCIHLQLFFKKYISFLNR